MKRFASHSNEDLLAKRAKAIPKNTSKANNSAASTLRLYLVEKNQDSNFEDFEIVRLAEVLCHFYMDARSKTGELYKATTFENLRHSLNRYLKAPPHLKKFDIITNPEFSDANECFKTAMSEIKTSGKGSVDHYPIIENLDLSKLYNSVFLSPRTPTGLQNRVQMNIRLYFCRRANENMEKMTKTTFIVRSYADTGRKYVAKQSDEMSKNHRESDRENISGHMPEDPTSPELCPVKTYETYLSKLSPKSDRLWQYPMESYSDDDNCWYQNRPIGRDSLAKFMPKLSKQASLSQIYTNHSCRVTGATILSQSNFSSAQIMSVTGQKSVSSLAVYQRISSREKEAMGDTISNTIFSRQSALALPTSLETPSIMPPSTNTAMTPYTSTLQTQNAYLDGVNIDDIFSDFGPYPIQQRPHYMPSFQGCTIHNLNITFNR